MTQRRESLPSLNGAEARWDAEASQVRYYANFDGSDDWVEVPGEDFARLSQHYVQQSIEIACHAVTDTLDNVKATLAEFMIFREKLVELYERQSATKQAEDKAKEN